MPRARVFTLWMVTWVLLGAVASGAQEDAVVDPRLLPVVERLESALEELDALERRWGELDQAERAEAASRRERVAILEAEFAASERRSPEIEDLYDQVNPLVETALDKVNAALTRASRPSELPGFITDDERSDLSLFGAADSDLPGTVGAERVELLQRQVQETGAKLEELELELRLEDVRRDLQLAARLYRLRLDLLKALPFDRLRVVHSLVREAPEAIALEAEALRVVGRYQWFNARGFVLTLGLMLQSFFVALLAGKMLVKLIVVGLLWRSLQRGRPAFIRALRARAGAVEDPAARQWSARLVDFVEAIAPWGVFLLGVKAFSWAIETDVSTIPFLLPLLTVAIVYGIYRLATDLVLGGIFAGMKSTGVEHPPALQARMRRGVAWIMRLAALVGYVLWILSLRVGEGVLFSLARRAGLTMVAVLIVVVVLRFRSQVRDVFLALKAHGWLADQVRGSGDRLSDLVITPLAFLWLCGRSVVGILRGITFSFSRTRSATAYLSRRRMAKVAERRGRTGVPIEELPSTLVEAFDDRLTVEDLEGVGAFPDLETARASADAWRAGTAAGSLLVAGEVGLGKEAWLEKFLSFQETAERHRFEERVLSAVRLRRWLADHLVGGGGESLGSDELIERINAGPRRVIVLEGGQNLFLATVNGYCALAELGPIVDATRQQVFWVMTISGLAWNHLRAAGKELAFLRRKIVLGRMDEEELQALVERRLELAGSSAGYADLMALEGRREDRASRDRLGKQTYFNLLADFSAGNPQIALHFFLRSLEPTSEGPLRVHPFAVPSEEDLLSVSEESLFLLAALMRHGSLNVEEAATTTAYPAGRLESLCLQLLDLGTIAEDKGVYSVRTNWRATVLRVLRRRNILIS